MQRDVIFARVDEDQEAVARQIDKYDLIAIPVVDANDMLVGIITHDDAMDILRQEQTEDILAFGGVSKDAEADDESYWQGRIDEAVRRRIGWLLLLFVAGTITRYVIHVFNWVDRRFPEIEFDAFIPLLIGTGGNAGSQTVGTIIRGLALGEIQRGDTLRVVAREVLTGLLLGALLGALGFVFIWLLLGHSPAFGAVIGLAILGICVWANGVGALVPLLARRFNIDPALVSAPLISTLVDATGLCIFYTVAIVLLIKLASALSSRIRVDPPDPRRGRPLRRLVEPEQVVGVVVVGQAEHPQHDHRRVEAEDPERPEGRAPPARNDETPKSTAQNAPPASSRADARDQAGLDVVPADPDDRLETVYGLAAIRESWSKRGRQGHLGVAGPHHHQLGEDDLVEPVDRAAMDPVEHDREPAQSQPEQRPPRSSAPAPRRSRPDATRASGDDRPHPGR